LLTKVNEKGSVAYKKTKTELEQAKKEGAPQKKIDGLQDRYDTLVKWEAEAKKMTTSTVKGQCGRLMSWDEWQKTH
jgi:hypothetical protein